MARKALTPGTSIGRFVIKAEQYQDDSGVTYLGEDTSISHRPSVYIREFFPASISRRGRNEVHAARRLLKREYASALAHQADRINRYLDAQTDGLIEGLERVDAFGTVYLVTAWPSGDHLRTMQERDGKFSPGFVRSILAEIEPGLTSLGNAGLVHGQIAPEMICQLDSGNVVVTHPDRLEYCSGEGPATLADPINTPYLAPEFISTDAGRIGPWSDVYSVAASFYQLITGIVPASAKARLETVAEGQDDPLDLVALETYLDDDPDLYRALASALSLTAGVRPASMGALIGAAELTIATPVDAPVEASGLSTDFSSTFFERYGRGVAALAAAVLILAVSVPLFLSSVDDEGPRQVVADNSVPSSQPDQHAIEEVVPEQVVEEATIELVEAPEPEEAVPADVAAWLAVDQNDPAAVLSFYEGLEDNPTLSAQVRARWLTLESEAWQAAQVADTSEAYTSFLEQFAPGAPDFALYVDAATDRLSALSQPEVIEAEEVPDVTLAEAEEMPSDAEAAEEMTVEGLQSEEISAVDNPVVEDTPNQPDAEVTPEADPEAEATTETPQDPELAVPETDETVEAEAPATDVTALEDAPETEQGDATAEMTEVESPADENDAPLSDCENCPTLVSVSALDGMMVSAHEISIAEFGFYLSATGGAAPAGCFTHRIDSASIWGYGSSASYADPGYPVTDSSPATCVSFDEAAQYTQWLSDETGETYRLLTSDEWSAMAGAPTPGLMACSANMADESLVSSGIQTEFLACSDGVEFTAAAEGNALSSTYGNVTEWVSDCLDDDCTRRLAMGGSWATGPSQVRGNMQEVFSPNSRSSTLGFRVLRE